MAKKITNPNPSPDTRFDGPRSNRNTKGNSSTRIKKSKLTKLLDSLLAREDVAMAIMDDVLANKGDRTADQKSAAQWLLNSLVTVSKACTAEELGSFNARLKGKREDEPEEQTPQQIASELKPRLSLVYVDPDEQEDD
jgi:hypothetical protein